MKKGLLLLFITFFLSCNAQKIEKLSKENTIDIGYMMSNLRVDKTIRKVVFKNAYHLTIFQYSDPNLGKLSGGTDEVYDSFLFTIAPDGDFYTKSVTYQIEKLCNPTVLSIEEYMKDKLKIVIEHGIYNKREQKEIIIDCNKI